MFSFLQDGGVFMYVILGVSVIALALFMERAVFLFFRLKLDADIAIQKIITSLENDNYTAALQECGRIESHPLGRILKAGLLRSDKKDKEIERVMEEKIMYEMKFIKTRINYLSMIANISTLLGLLGTIFGLITSFKGVGNADAAMKQEVLAQGISVAMSTTAFGLIVSVPCIAGYYLLNNRGDYIVAQFDEKALALFNVLSSLKNKGRQEASV